MMRARGMTSERQCFPGSRGPQVHHARLALLVHRVYAATRVFGCQVQTAGDPSSVWSTRGVRHDARTFTQKGRMVQAWSLQHLILRDQAWTNGRAELGIVNLATDSTGETFSSDGNLRFPWLGVQPRSAPASRPNPQILFTG